ncbi:MAG: hypothetical protein WC716_11900 [Chitinophagaceae bacterium]
MFQEKKFYTKDHEWLHFNGNQAYLGVSKFKLTGIRKIEHIELFGFRNGDVIEQGMLMLRLNYTDYVISLHAPIKCILLETNCIISEGNWDQIIALPEEEGWLFKIEHIGTDQNHLIIECEYQERFLSSHLTNP